jgi:cephalosporin hydroxylase
MSDQDKEKNVVFIFNSTTDPFINEQVKKMAEKFN